MSPYIHCIQFVVEDLQCQKPVGHSARGRCRVFEGSSWHKALPKSAGVVNSQTLISLHFSSPIKSGFTMSWHMFSFLVSLISRL